VEKLMSLPDQDDPYVRELIRSAKESLQASLELEGRATSCRSTDTGAGAGFLRWCRAGLSTLVHAGQPLADILRSRSHDITVASSASSMCITPVPPHALHCRLGFPSSVLRILPVPSQ
jgi:hypothetical protein